MVKKIAFALIALAIAWFGGRALVHAFASDETLIRWKLEDACEGFNDTRMSPILDFIARDFVDQRTGAHREDVRGRVAGLFFTAKDPKTRKFPYRAEVLPDTLVVEIDAADKKRAVLKCTIRVTDTSAGGQRNALQFHMNGKLVDGADGWQLVEAMRENNEGDDSLK